MLDRGAKQSPDPTECDKVLRDSSSERLQHQTSVQCCTPTLGKKFLERVTESSNGSPTQLAWGKQERRHMVWMCLLSGSTPSDALCSTSIRNPTRKVQGTHKITIP
jgi:hypothetical protein